MYFFYKETIHSKRRHAQTAPNASYALVKKLEDVENLELDIRLNAKEDAITIIMDKQVKTHTAEVVNTLMITRIEKMTALYGNIV